MTIQSPLVFGLFILASSERYLHHYALEFRPVWRPLVCVTGGEGPRVSAR